MANEAAASFLFLRSLLGADSTLTALLSATTAIFRDVALPGTLPDWLVIGHQSGSDVLTSTAVRIMSPNLYRVLAVGPEAHYANLKAIADQVDADLMPSGRPLRSTSSGGVAILSCYREMPLAISEIVAGAAGGTAWINLGGLYRIEI